MLKPGWFPEYLPWEQYIFDQIKRIIEKQTQQLWYINIQTPAVEKNEILLKGGKESSKQIFWLYWLAQWSEDTKNYSLHFDLTIPLARYVLDHTNELVFPFKRSQIQPVRRWERSQRWRFKEFRQADIDTIRQDNEKPAQNLFYDAEIMFLASKIINEVISTFDLNYTVLMQLNNRKLVQWFANAVLETEQEKTILFKLLDDYYKIWEEKFEKWVKELTTDQKKQSKILEYSKLTIETLHEDFVNNDLFKQWLVELKTVFWYIDWLNLDNKCKFKFDPTIMRWLDYYTGTVFETFFQEDIKLGSVYSGGRYENLTQAINPKGPKYEWVGISMWISRLCALLFEKTKSDKQTTSKYLFLHFEETFNETAKLVNKFLSEWKSCEIYPSPDKLKKQFNYANKKQIPYVIILGEGELEKWEYKIKNMENGEEEIFGV